MITIRLGNLHVLQGPPATRQRVVTTATAGYAKTLTDLVTVNNANKIATRLVYVWLSGYLIVVFLTMW